MDMKKMMQQAQKMQRDALAAQEEIQAMKFEASAGGGMVTATVNGEGKLVGIKIDPKAVDTEDIEMLEDTILAAATEAANEASEVAANRLNGVMGGMNIPGLI